MVNRLKRETARDITILVSGALVTQPAQVRLKDECD